MLYTHIPFEKIHPFIDANGRIERLILQKSISRITGYTSVIPISWSFFNSLSEYYESFDIEDISDVDKGIQNLLNIIWKMCSTTKEFLLELKHFKEINLEKIQSCSFKVTDEIAERILLTLQTQTHFLQKRFNLNSRTVDNIFDKINLHGLDFNTKTINRRKLF